MDKLKEKLGIVQIIVIFVIIIAGWVSNYTIMEEKINYLDKENTRLDNTIHKIELQLKDYNVLIYKVDKLDKKIDRVLNELENRDNI